MLKNLNTLLINNINFGLTLSNITPKGTSDKILTAFLIAIKIETWRGVNAKELKKGINTVQMKEEWVEPKSKILIILFFTIKNFLTLY